MSTLHQDDGPIATGQKVMLATTAYDSPDDSYTFAIAQSREALAEVGIQSAYVLLSGNCHVDDARNSVVYTFMESDCTDLIFLDADVSWRKEDLVMLCQYDLDLVGGVYPYRREDGRAKRGMPYIPMDGAEVKDGLVEVIGLPTGFMRIRRNVFDTLIPLNPKFDNNQKSMKDIPLLFERTLKEGTRMGGDLNFCLKWVEAGGSLYASTECLLGHVAKTVIKDSLGAFIRRHNDQTLQNFVEKLQAGTETDADFREAFDYVNNPWGAENGFLTVAAHAARTANKSGPILESGSGLTTIVMAACAPDQMVYCLEHNEHFANITRIMARACGLTNIAIVHTEIKDRWYDITDPLPDHWALGLNDGPPRQLGDRMKFLYFLGDSCDMIISDDADDPEYAASLTSWADNKDRQIAFPEPRSAIIMKEAA